MSAIYVWRKALLINPIQFLKWREWEILPLCSRSFSRFPSQNPQLRVEESPFWSTKKSYHREQPAHTACFQRSLTEFSPAPLLIFWWGSMYHRQQERHLRQMSHLPCKIKLFMYWDGSKLLSLSRMIALWFF